MWIYRIFFCLLLFVVLTTIETEANSSGCEQKEKNIAILDLAKESISKARKLHPTSINDAFNISSNSSECGIKEKVSAYLDIAMNLLEDAKKNYTSCVTDITVTENITNVVYLHKSPIDCSQILENGDNESGQYIIWPNHRIFEGRPLKVYCDMDTDGGGWTVIQRRGNFSNIIDFYRNWADYKYGFGKITEEFWIGNENIFGLTNQADYVVRFDMETLDRKHYFATYSSFYIDGESADYMLHFGNFSGTAGDGISTMRNMKFSTKDKRNDVWTKPCTDLKQGGFWYSSCGGSNPNGINQPGRNGAKYMNWETLRKYDSLQAIDMKIRPEN